MLMRVVSYDLYALDALTSFRAIRSAKIASKFSLKFIADQILILYLQKAYQQNNKVWFSL